MSRLLPSLIWALCFIAPHFSVAAVLGRFDHVRNIPGYIELNDKSSPVFDVQKVLGISSKPQKDGIERRSPSQLLYEVYLNQDGSVNVDAIRAKIQQIHFFMKGDFVTYCTSEGEGIDLYSCPNLYGDTNNEVYKDWLKKTTGRAAKFAIGELERAIDMGLQSNFTLTNIINRPEAQDFLEALFQGLDMYESLRGEQEDSGTTKEKIRNTITVIDRMKIKDGPEAANLVIPGPLRNDLLFSDPRELKSAGFDLSAYDPMDSGFWRKPDGPISQFDTSNYGGKLQEAVSAKVWEKIKDIEDPSKQLSVMFHEQGGGGLTPKMTVKWGDYKLKMKILLAPYDPKQASNPVQLLNFFTRGMGSEVRSEFVVNNLAAAIGYTVDPTYYKKSVRLFLKDNFDPALASTDEGKTEIRDRFLKARDKVLLEMTNEGPQARELTGGFKHNYFSVLQNIRVVETGEQKGRHYIEVESVSLEFKRDKDLDWKVSLFNKSTMGRSLKREFRAFQIFYMWIHDVDGKDDNAATGLVDVDPEKSGGVREKMYFSATDMGFTLGGFFGKNRPNFLDYDILDTKNSKLTGPLEKRELQFNMRGFFKNRLFEATNINDIRWIMRRIGQLTREQIKTTFLTADYPEVVAELYTEKLLRRRDQLMSAVGLDRASVTADDGQRNVVLSANTSRIEDPKTFSLPQCRSCFDNGELVSLPEGVTSNETWTLSVKSYPKGSTQEQFRDALWDTLAQVGVNAIGRQMQKIELKGGITVFGAFLSVNSFMPARFLINNPFDDENRRLLLVDVFRVGVAAGFSQDWEKLNILPSSERFAGRAGAVETFEFIRVRPIENNNFSLKEIIEIYKPNEALGKPLRDVKEDMVRGMQEGDILLSSRYLTFGAQVRTAATSVLIGPGVALEAAAFSTLVDRITVQKEADNKYLTTWTDIRRMGGQIAAFFDFLIAEVPVAAVRYEKLKELDRSYRFDLNNPDDARFLLSNLNRDIPDNVPSRYAVGTKSITQSVRQVMFSFLSLFKWRKYTRKTAGTLTNAEEQLVADIYAYEKGNNSKDISIRSLSHFSGTESTAMVDRKNKLVLAKIELGYTKGLAFRKDYEYMIEEFKGLIPPQMVLFDSKTVNYYLGSLDLDGTILFSNSALEDILGQQRDTRSACEHFAQYSRLKFSEEGELTNSQIIKSFCDKYVRGDFFSPGEYARRVAIHPADQSKIQNILRGAHNFVKKFQAAQQKYLAFKAADDKALTNNRKLTEDVAKSVVDLFQSTPLPGTVHMALLSMTSLDKIYRDITMRSHLSGFPGRVQTLSLNKEIAGDDELESLEFFQYANPAHLLQSVVDPIYTAISPFFYNYYWQEGVKFAKLEVDERR